MRKCELREQCNAASEIPLTLGDWAHCAWEAGDDSFVCETRADAMRAPAPVRLRLSGPRGLPRRTAAGVPDVPQVRGGEKCKHVI